MILLRLSTSTKNNQQVAPSIPSGMNENELFKK